MLLNYRGNSAHSGNRQTVQGQEGVLPHGCRPGRGEGPHGRQQDEHRPDVHIGAQDIRSQGRGGPLHPAEAQGASGGAAERGWTGKGDEKRYGADPAGCWIG